MSKSTLESLPNELLLIIFSYLSSFDLCQAFLYLNNARIQHLLTSIRHSFNVNLMHYDQLHLWLNSNQNHRNHFTNLINTVVFNDSYASRTLLEYWEKTFNGTDQFNVLFPSIKRLVMLQAECYSYTLIQAILIPLVFANNTLQYLHLIFKEPASNYPRILSKLILHRISVHTMILEVEQGMLLKILSK
ncbi:unnamed protein product [Rotaria sordida]|uniref:F-box domain-containing protein n=1 Tax=Rotaria sordida TaxID=392033 RepID=A0A814X6N1_9BILA|nr:unnamed protein product [Rotaria sordida]CAF1282466.1 unnamed protein product [Rotaria sordida]CAF4056081.1 unnamed protein product [Rotaria sordida]